jgi:prevent-host-death family protein
VTVNVHEAKTKLSKLLAHVERGGDVVICRAGVPVARLVAPEPARRKLGTASGRVRIAKDFDAPLPADLQADFER